MHRKLKTPCIGICSTTYGDVVCRGCKRFLHEIIDWNKYQDDEQRIVLERLELMLEQVVKNRIFISDIFLLEDRLGLYEIPYNMEANQYCWVHSLLNHGATKIKSLFDCGIVALGDSEFLSITQLRDAIDEDFFALSEAHYDRYFSASRVLKFD
jgi:hypothetical protein